MSRAVETNPVAQTATISYDPAVTSVDELGRVVERCGFECAGCNVPGSFCDPLREPGASMRTRFVYSLIFTLAILAWSGVGKSRFGHQLATPLGSIGWSGSCC